MRIDAGELIACDHVDDRAHDAAVEPAGTAKNENDKDIRRALETERLERDRLRRLRQQRASHARDRRRNRVHLANVRDACRSYRRHADRLFTNAAQRQPERRIDQLPRHQESQGKHRESVGVGRVAVEVELK